MLIKPIGDKVLVREDTQPDSIDGIVLPDIVHEETWSVKSGEVVGVGEGKSSHMADGSVVITPPDVNMGDHVFFDEWAGAHFDLDDVGYRLLDREQVLAVEVA